MPGPENFLRRRALWLLVSKDESVEAAGKKLETSKLSTTSASALPEENPNTSKFLTISTPEYIVYTDGELEQVRSYYFEQKRLGPTTADMSKELFCRLIRNTMTNMISIARALQDSRYPSKHEVDTMAKRLVEYYPMLKGTSGDEWGHIAKKLMKRLSNIKIPKTAGTPSRKRRMTSEQFLSDDFEGYSTGSSQASTIIIERSPAASSTPQPNLDTSEEDAVGSADQLDTPKSQARHYKALQNIRRFITSEVLKEQDRAAKVIEAYPCFKELDHVLDEMQRIIQPKNSNYIAETLSRWENFFSKVKFYGVMKKAMKPPKTLNIEDHALAVFAALPDLFPSGAPPPKKLGACSEAFSMFSRQQRTLNVIFNNGHCSRLFCSWAWITA
uniref:Uncharacterized protein n=1 Tax=Knipowitschia caucasica TaxID=637954 RepID=A0AAV2K6R9_KNICA